MLVAYALSRKPAHALRSLQGLAPLAEARSGSAGPLVWFGLFDAVTTIPSAEVPAWL